MGLIKSACLLGALSSLSVLVEAATGPANTNPGCKILIQNPSSIYYNQSNTANLEQYFSSTGCSAGSFAPVTLRVPGDGTTQPGQSTVSCGSLALDGKQHFVDCPGYPRGTIRAGVYEFDLSIGYGVAFDRITITHVQSTSTVSATPTTTVTTTPVRTATTTVTDTFTDTATSAQVTVTDPKRTRDFTVTSTAQPVTQTTTTTVTYTAISVDFVVFRTQVTETASCTTRTASAAPIMTAVDAKRHARDIGFHLLKRQNAGLGLNNDDGDGPLTTTITPNLVIKTSTASAITTTVSAFTFKTTTTTVAANPQTVTVRSGVTTDIITKTVPGSTVTRTSTATAVTSTTSTVTKTQTRTRTITPACSRVVTASA